MRRAAAAERDAGTARRVAARRGDKPRCFVRSVVMLFDEPKDRVASHRSFGSKLRILRSVDCSINQDFDRSVN